MYLQSAEILNFHGIRHLKIEFNPETSALIGENAWGKSSLLSALWLILGQGSDQLCTFSKNDLYIPIRLGSDIEDDASDKPKINASKSVNSTRPLAAATSAAIPQSALSLPEPATTTDTTADAAPATMEVTPPHDPLEEAAKGILGEAIRHMTYQQVAELKPHKVVKLPDHYRFYFAIPTPDHSSKILRVVDLPLATATSPQDKTLAASSTATITKGGKDKGAKGAAKSQEKTQDKSSPAGSVSQDAKQDNDSLYQALNAPDPETLFKALQDAQSIEAFAKNPDSAISARHLMLRARKLLDREDLNEWVRCFAQADYEFFANDIYQAEAEKIVIDLIFCESNFGAINNIERFAKLRPACYYGEDGLYRVHYRITGQEAKLYVQNQNLQQLSMAMQSGTVVYADSGSATSTQAYKNGHAPQDFPDSHIDVVPDTKFVTTHDLLDANGKPIDNALEIIKDLIKLNPLLRLRDRRMLKLSEMEEALRPSGPLDAPCASTTSGSNSDSTNSLDGSTDPTFGDNGSIDLHSNSSPDPNEDLRHLNSLFVSISQEDDLTCSQLNQGLAELNVIASKYLVNYRANPYLVNTQQAKSRTAREIVSHPVSIETLNSLKQSLEDKRPSRSKFLLSLLAGAMLMNKGTQEIDHHSKPILVLEDIEGRFHPTLLLTLWSILDTIPVQKIVTTNSSDLLAAMPMSNIRRLCRQYYDVRCYSIAEHAFNADDERRIAFHIRISRPSAFFARCWILVEGETEVWILNEIAAILGMNLACEGVKLIEFAQCGLAPLIKLAKQLGISYYVLTDGDDAGKKYAQTVQGFTGNHHLSDHLSVIPHLDIEHYLYVSGYADVYQKAAGLKLQPKKSKRSRQDLSQLLKQAKEIMNREYQQQGLSTEDKQSLLASINEALANSDANQNGLDAAATPDYDSAETNSYQIVMEGAEDAADADADTKSATADSDTAATTPEMFHKEQSAESPVYGTTQTTGSDLNRDKAAQDRATSESDGEAETTETPNSKQTPLPHLLDETTIEAAPVPATVSLPQVLQSLQRWFSYTNEQLRHLKLRSVNTGKTDVGFLEVRDMPLGQQERLALQQAIYFAQELLQPKSPKHAVPLNQQVKALTFDISKVSINEISQYYEKAELNLKRSGGLNRKLTNKQRQAIQRLHLEKAEVLYGLNLTNQKPKTKHLFKTKTNGSRKARHVQSSLKDNFTLPSSLYNYLKHNFVNRNKSRMNRLKQQVSTKQLNPNFRLRQSLTKSDWVYIKQLISKLQSLQHHNNSQLKPQELRTIKSKALALELLNHPAQLRSDVGAPSFMDHQPTDLAQYKHRADGTIITKDPAGTVDTNGIDSVDSKLSPKQWVSKLAQSDQGNANLMQTDLELTKAQFNPLDEAKIMRKARQQAGIKYGDYGAIEQSLLNKQGWTIDKIIDVAIHKKSKPGLAIVVIEAMQQRGKEAVPQMFRTMFLKIKRIAKSEFGL